MKYAIQELSKRKAFVLISIIQLTTTFVLIILSISLAISSNSTSEKIYSIYNDKSVVFMRDKSDEAYLLEENLLQDNATKRLYEFYEFLKSNSAFKFIPFLDYSIDVANYLGDSRFVKSWMNKDTAEIKAFKVSDKFQDEFSFDVIEGRCFEESDFASQEITPAILGYDYRSYYKVGEVFQLDSANLPGSIEVIGFLKEGTFFPSRFSSSPICNVDQYMIFPFTNLTENNKFFEFDTQVFQSMIITKDKDYDDIVSTISKKSKDLDLYTLSFSKPMQMGENFVKGVAADTFVINLLLAFVFFFCSIGICTSLLAHVREKMQIYGIHLLVGATLHRIAFRIFAEVASLVLVSLMISIFIAVFLNGWSDSILLLLPISALLTICLSALPLLHILNADIPTLTRRKE